MKKIYILLFSVLLAVCCVVSASAAGFGGFGYGHGGGFANGYAEGFESHWISEDEWRSVSPYSPSATNISYDALCQLVIDLNAINVPVSVDTYVYDASADLVFYVVRGTGSYTFGEEAGNMKGRTIDLTGLFFSTSDQKVFVTRASEVEALSYISQYVRLISQKLTTIIDTLTSIVSEGKVKINDTNILAALTSINNNFQGILDGSLTINGSPFDDADVLSAIDANTQAVTNAEAALTGGLTRIVDAIDYNFGEYPGTHVFPSLNNDQAVVGDKAELFESISGKVLYSSLNRIYICPRSFVTNFTINVVGNYTCERYTCVFPTHVQHIFLLSGDMRPSTPVEVSVPCFNFLGALSMEKTKIFPVAWRYNPSADAFVASTVVTFYFSKSPEGYPVSTDPAAYDHPYVYALDPSPVDVVFSSRFTAFQQLENTRLINALSGLDYSSSLNTIIDKLDALIAKSGDTVVNVIEDDTYIPKVFYLDDDTSAVGTTKDGISLFSDLVRWLWKNVFDGAFGAADIAKLDGLFYDPAAVEEVP